MKTTKDCNIIKDLLPSYAYNLTTEETNKFVEEHLENCDVCKKVLENIKSEENKKETEKTKKYINVAKKYNRKIKFLVLIIVFILLMIFSLTFLRNLIIVEMCNNKGKKYYNSNNYHVTWASYNSKNSIIYDTYYKDGRYVEKMTSYNFDYYNQEKTIGQAIMYYDGKGTLTTYFPNEKVIDTREVKPWESMTHPVATPTMGVGEYPTLEGKFRHLLMVALMFPISTEKCNGKECYRYSYFTMGDSHISYYDKETGLILRSKNSVWDEKDGYQDNFSDMTYEFDTVTDEQVAMPSTEGYTVQ